MRSPSASPATLPTRRRHIKRAHEVHDAADIGRFLVHDARTGNTASEVGVVKEVCGAVYGGPYLITDLGGPAGGRRHVWGSSRISTKVRHWPTKPHPGPWRGRDRHKGPWARCRSARRAPKTARHPPRRASRTARHPPRRASSTARRMIDRNTSGQRTGDPLTCRVGWATMLQRWRR